jgi:hypothetical protein
VHAHGVEERGVTKGHRRDGHSLYPGWAHCQGPHCHRGITGTPVRRATRVED